MQVLKQTNFTNIPGALMRFMVVGIFSFCILNATMAQKQTVKGIVKDIKGESMIGVSVLVKGTTNGTITNYDGQYSIDVNSAKDVLVFSYVGYNNYETVVGNRSVLDVRMTEDTKALDELIVVGYGTQRKSDLTGSVVSVKAEEMNAIPTTSVAEMLRGQVAGLSVTQNSARPGGSSDIVIRGKRSIKGGNSPLFIVDGVPVSGIDDYNSQDILSVEVLKDASSQAIYGARAANGVILITTKRGNENKTSIDFSAYVGQQQLKRNFDFFSPEEWVQLSREANRKFVVTKNANGTHTVTDSEYLNGNPVDGVYPGDVSVFGNMNSNVQNKVYTDWEKLAVKPSMQQKYDLSLRSGSKNTKLSTSVGYFAQEGMIAPAAYERFNFRFNVDHKISEKLLMSMNLNYSNSNRQTEDETFSRFVIQSPLLNPFNANGTYKDLLEDSKPNPLFSNQNQDNKRIDNNYLMNISLDWEIIKGLKYRLNASMNNRNQDQGTYLTTLHEKGKAFGGVATKSLLANTDYLIENILTYDKKIDADNKFDITAVQSQEFIKNTVHFMKSSGFTSDELGYNFIGSGAKQYPAIIEITPRTLLSYMGRLRYNLMEKYLFSASARIDGSSVFGVNNKWGIFPAGSFAWRASEEDFLKSAEWISNLKLRLTYGNVGNQAIGPYQSQGVADSYSFQFGTGDPYIGYLPGSQLPNPSLKWETTTSFNGGIDFAVLKDRISTTIELYRSVTKDLLFEREINQTTGYSSQLVNLGKVENKGVEITVNTTPVKTKDFSWNVDFNLTINRNKILELDGQIDPVTGQPKNDVTNNLFVGHNIDAYYYQQFDGIWQLSDSIPNYKGSYKAQPGDVRVKDINNDTTINDYDRVIMDRSPKWIGSLSSSILYKGFEFSFDLYTVQGTLRLNPYLYDYNSGGGLSGSVNGMKVDYWTVENPSNTAPRPSLNTKTYMQSLAYQDASYVRLRNMSLAYNIPKKWLNEMKLTRLKIYASATNLLTFTKFLSYSPEATAGAYPEPKTFVVGLNVSL